ncbi:PE-PPE domain-containing protein [Mycolicibacterium rufum]|uniref:PE-PPE domain-containing protein n=1 Tax=Mycolicibacterium rufum TaxID=318424 RepID=A0A9X2YDJ4_9MYCO|nr:PE-PPE domain-containing protein [Mycolicibacterium rufum]MCV7071778.1 PE-PPE domain-containing protein [Mycolicibacterium rufum]ULP35779.1 PE-PPE domain-containing protein [Mycolicibacterium rufum]
MKRLVILLALSLLAISPATAHAATALLVGGAGKYHVLTDEDMATAMGGYFADYTRVNVAFPGQVNRFKYSVDVGTANLYAAVYDTAGPTTIGSVSAGSPVIYNVLRMLDQDPNPPAPTELDAAVYGGISPRWYRGTGVKYQPLPETPYNLKVVKAEYDGIADWPDNPFNGLAAVNAVMGAFLLHVPMAYYDISQVPADHITVSEPNSRGGVTTSILIPTPVLPLLQPMLQKGADPDRIAQLDAKLRPIVDRAYKRNQTTTVDATAATKTTEATEASDRQEPRRIRWQDRKADAAERRTARQANRWHPQRPTASTAPRSAGADTADAAAS